MNNSSRTRKLTFTVMTIAIVFGFSIWVFRDTRQGSTNQGVPVLRFGTLFRALDYAPYYVAREKGWLDEALNGKAKIQHLPTFQTPPSANEAMATNRADIVLTAGVPAIVARAAGVKLRIPMLSCTLSSQVVVRAESPYQKLSDLDGRRIAVAFGTGPHYGIYQHLQKLNLLPPAVELLDMVPPDAKAALQSRAVEAWAIFPPYIEQEVLAGTGKVLQDVTSPVQVVVTVREGMTVEYPDLINTVLTVFSRAKQWLKANPEEAQNLLSKQLELPLDVVKLGWERLDWSASIKDGSVHQDLQNKADFLVEKGFTKQAVNVKESLLERPSL